MDVIYKCRCMVKEITIAVPDRRPNTDIEPWLNMVTFCIGMDHKALSPRCFAEKMDYMKIPMDEGTEQIGTPVTRN